MKKKAKKILNNMYQGFFKTLFFIIGILLSAVGLSFIKRKIQVGRNKKTIKKIDNQTVSNTQIINENDKIIKKAKEEIKKNEEVIKKYSD